MKNIFLLSIIILTLSSCSSNAEYIKASSNVNTAIMEYIKSYNTISSELNNELAENEADLKSFRRENRSDLLGLEKQATKAINEINKAHSIKHKCESMDKLFEEMRHNIMEGIYNIRFESNSFLYMDRESTVLQEYLKYMQRYDIELRSALN